MNSQLRYNNDVYDILCNIVFGEYQYSIIGTGTNNKIFDIAFVEKIVENEKIRYVSPNINSEQLDSNKVVSYALMDHVVNNIKDCINQDILLTRDDTTGYVNNCAEVLSQDDIVNLVVIHNDVYNNDVEERIRRVNSIYDDSIDKYIQRISSSVLTDDEPEKTVDDIYDELEKTQNFGVSIIHDYEALLKENKDNYITEPTNHIYTEKSESSENVSLDEKEDKESIQVNDIQDSQNIDSNNVSFNTNADKLTVSDIKFMLEKKSDSMTLQQKLYWENELKRAESSLKQASSANDMQNARNKTYTLSNGKSLLKDNAAYVTIYFLIALIGSFELLLTIIMIVKFQ